MSYLYSDENLNDTLASEPPRNWEPEDFKPNAWKKYKTAAKDDAIEAVEGATEPLRLGARAAYELGARTSLAVSTLVPNQNGKEWIFSHVTDPMLDYSHNQLSPEGYHEMIKNAFGVTKPDLPTPEILQTATHIYDGFAKGLIDYGISGGNPLVFGLNTGVQRAAEESHEGKDLLTAERLGVITGLTNFAFTGFAPAFISSRIPVNKTIQGVLTGTGLSAGINEIASNFEEKALKNYPEEQQQFIENKNQSRAIAAAFGAVFGGLHSYALPSHIDALHTIRDANSLDHPEGIEAGDSALQNKITDSMNDSVEHLINSDEPLNHEGLLRTKADDIQLDENFIPKEYPDDLQKLQNEKPIYDFTNMSNDEIEKAYQEAKNYNLQLDIEAVKKYESPETLARFLTLNQKGRDKFLDEEAKPETFDNSSMVKGINESKLDELRTAAFDFDETNAYNLGRSIAIKAKNLDQPNYIGSPDWLTVKNALQYATENNFSMDEIIHGMKDRGVEWAGNDVEELFSHLFKNSEKSNQTKQLPEINEPEKNINPMADADELPSYNIETLSEPKLNNQESEASNIEITSESENQKSQSIETEEPELKAARQILSETQPDYIHEIEMEDGTIETGTLHEIMKKLDEDQLSNNPESAIDAAVTCFLRFGDA